MSDDEESGEDCSVEVESLEESRFVQDSEEEDIDEIALI